MRLRDVGLVILVLMLSATAASAQGFSQSFGASMGSNQTDDFLSIGFPWDEFSSGDFSFSETSGFNFSSAYSYYSEYYYHSGTSITGGIISTPTRFEVTKRAPARIYVGGQMVPYSQYASSVSQVLPNQLWIQGQTDWNQYVVCPVGTWLQLVANTPKGGQAEFYEINMTAPGQGTVIFKPYQFYPGYNTMSFNAASVGRHILLFVLENQPSTAVVVDVAPLQVFQQPQVQQPQTQLPSGQGIQSYVSVNPAPIQASSTQSYPGSYSGTQYLPSPSPQPTPVSGDTPVTIQTSLKGYQVFLDGAYIGTEGTGGDPLDGVYRFSLMGGQTHDVRIFDGQNYYGKPMYFERGVPKIINVPPAATIYVPA